MVDELKAIYYSMLSENFNVIPAHSEDHYMSRVVNKYHISLVSTDAGPRYSQIILNYMIIQGKGTRIDV